MNRRHLLVVATILLVGPSLTWGAGFALFEHGNRAMAMGGAFTAVADDPSALYWNPAGTAFQQDKGVQVMAGVTFITAGQTFYGDSPYPGDGYTAEQKDQIFYPPHFYMVFPVGDRITLNFAVMTPFGLGTWWEEDHAGRFISKRVDLKLFDFAPSISFKVNEYLALSVGADYGIAQIDLTRQLGTINPYTQQVADIGQVHLSSDGTGNDGWGWNASIHGKLPAGFSIGATYRSNIDIEATSAYGSFTQYPTGYPDFDAVVSQLAPFGQKTPVRTAIDFPEYWVIGLAWTDETWTVSGSYGAQGWSSFQELAIEFPEYPDNNSVIEEDYEDVDQYRLGVEYVASETWAFQGGVLYDHTPQPRQSMSPLLGDSDRTGISIGFSWSHGSMRTDVGYMYLMFDDRSTDGLTWDGYNGRYDTTAHLLGATLTLSF
jgi:long-chain fatty acid transport protein